MSMNFRDLNQILLVCRCLPPVHQWLLCSHSLLPGDTWRSFVHYDPRSLFSTNSREIWSRSDDNEPNSILIKTFIETMASMRFFIYDWHEYNPLNVTLNSKTPMKLSPYRIVTLYINEVNFNRIFSTLSSTMLWIRHQKKEISLVFKISRFYVQNRCHCVFQSV